MNEGGTFYTVRQGDTLASLAQRFYGDVNAYHLIMNANSHLKDLEMVKPGQELRIPQRTS